MPPRFAASTPAGASSATTHSSGVTPRRSAASRKPSGSGLPARPHRRCRRTATRNPSRLRTRSMLACGVEETAPASGRARGAAQQGQRARQRDDVSARPRRNSSSLRAPDATLPPATARPTDGAVCVVSPAERAPELVNRSAPAPRHPASPRPGDDKGRCHQHPSRSHSTALAGLPTVIPRDDALRPDPHDDHRLAAEGIGARLTGRLAQ
jgi:hypothetical protein